MVVSFLRALGEARWFGRERAAGYARVMILVFVPTLIWFYFEALGRPGSDFVAFWSAARLAIAGHPASAYDPAAMQAVQSALGRTDWFPFLNPPPFLMLVAPLGLLPLPVALPVWVVATYAAWLAVARRISRDAFWPIAAFPGALVAAWHAQNGFVIGALFIGAILSLRSRPWLAGVLLGALIIKPHLAILVPVALIASRNWKAFGAAGGTAIGLLGASALLLGPDVVSAFVAGSSISEGLLGGSRPDFFLRMPTVHAGVSLVAGTTVGLALQGLATVASAIAVWLVWSRSDDMLGRGAVLAAATILATPYAFHYDLPLLIVAVCWWARDAATRGWAPWERPLLAGFYWSPLMIRATAVPLGFNGMPLILGAFLAFSTIRLLDSTQRPQPQPGEKVSPVAEA